MKKESKKSVSKAIGNNQDEKQNAGNQKSAGKAGTTRQRRENNNIHTGRNGSEK